MRVCRKIENGIIIYSGVDFIVGWKTCSGQKEKTYSTPPTPKKTKSFLYFLRTHEGMEKFSRSCYDLKLREFKAFSCFSYPH